MGEGADRLRGVSYVGATVVIAGLDPAIHPLRKKVFTQKMDPRVKPAGDGTSAWRDVRGVMMHSAPMRLR
jgi:hypothetical protein